MKIYVLPVDKILQPDHQSIEYPVGNHDYGVEQDFFEFIKNSGLLAKTPEEADWHYLPVFWTRWHLNHDYGRKGLSELRKHVKRALIDTTKTFTICQYADGPLIDLGSTTMFFTSRKTKTGIDIPLLRSQLKSPIFRPKRRYLASFVGRLDTHTIRKRMHRELKDRSDILLKDGNEGQDYFTKTLLESYVALCPRGHGGGSFRFFEAMQLGVTPMLIGDIDVRPFKFFIDWDSCSLYAKTAQEMSNILSSKSKRELARMGKAAKKIYYSHLYYGHWCTFVIKELDRLK